VYYKSYSFCRQNRLHAEHREFWINGSYSRRWLLCRYSNWLFFKVIKLVAVIVGLFLAGLVYLQYNQIANINWNKLQTIAEGTITTLSNVVMQIPGTSITNINGHAAATASLAMTSFGIPLAGSMSAGFTLGFIKG
jgi:uncharacterized membrane protein (Fun14 family)